MELISPMPNHCIDCDKVATVTHDGVPYCVYCYRKEIMKDEKEDKNTR